MKKIVLFINKRCVHYHVAKKLLLDKEVTFEEKDIEDIEVRQELLKRKIFSVPTFFIDDAIVVGINVVKLNELLK